MTKNRPNILVITTDQQAAVAMSCTGNAHLKTPAMDRIARQGIRYEKAYCADPICVPSRTSYMTGTMPHENGITINAETATLDNSRFPCPARLFRESGYDTGYFGKWHVPADIHDREWSGFNKVASIRNNEVDHEIAEPCLSFIQQKRVGPFLAFASFVNPHDICEFARLLSDMPDRLKNGDIPSLPSMGELPPLPTNWQPPEDEPQAIREHYHQESTRSIYPSSSWMGPEDLRWRQYLWAYYRLVELVDKRIGQLLDGLEQAGLMNDTLIVFTSDHGDGMASHHWNQKTLFYDQCARIPFILSWPGRLSSGQVNTSHLVNIGIDLFPTIMDAAGVKQPARLRGLSALDREESEVRSYIVCENNLQPAMDVPGEADGRMVRSQRYKYVRYSSGRNQEQLFDMETDPLETVSLASDPGHTEVLNLHRQMLREWAKETGDPFPVN